jgi:hypothetical protein
MAKEPSQLSDLLRKTIVDSGISLRQLSIDTGLTRSSLQRFRDRRQFLSLDAADKLAHYFGLELRKKR